MKQHLSILFCVLFLTFMGACENKKNTQSAYDEKADIDKLYSLIHQQEIDWNKGDIDSYMKGYWQSDKMQYIVKKHVRKGYDLVLANYKRHYHSKELMGKLSFDKLEYQALDDAHTIYQVTGLWKVEAQDTSDGNFSLIFKKIDNDFKIIIDHTF
ncbi:MAG TPA: DUF4440 domain-containing protein [Bacteroidia bacterium]